MGGQEFSESVVSVEMLWKMRVLLNRGKNSLDSIRHFYYSPGKSSAELDRSVIQYGMSLK